MYDLENRVVFVTGASAGIGEACARAFAPLGVKLLLCARRGERLEQLAGELRDAHGTKSHTFTLDVRDRAAVNAAVTGLPPAWQPIEVLVNNAGLSRGLDKLYEGSAQDWDEMIDTNVKGLLWVTRAVAPGMVDRGGGHIINIGSIAGHETYPRGNVYCASKRAVAAITDGLRQDLLGTGLRVTTVDPGLCETEFSLVRFHGDAERAKQPYTGVQPLTGADVADAVVYAATRPPHVSIHEVIIMPTAQPKATMVHRQR